MIGCTEEEDANRVEATTLPRFANENRCANCQRSWGVWVLYCPGCRRIAGQHFHRECPCGARWDER